MIKQLSTSSNLLATLKAANRHKTSELDKTSKESQADLDEPQTPALLG